MLGWHGEVAMVSRQRELAAQAFVLTHSYGAVLGRVNRFLSPCVQLIDYLSEQGYLLSFRSDVEVDRVRS